MGPTQPIALSDFLANFAGAIVLLGMIGLIAFALVQVAISVMKSREQGEPKMATHPPVDAAPKPSIARVKAMSDEEIRREVREMNQQFAPKWEDV